MKRLIALGIIFLSLGACAGPGGTTADSAQGRNAQERPPATPPAPMSHGEAPVGVAAATDRTADAPPRSTLRLHRVRLATAHVRHQIAPGIVYDAWTFDSIVPGPFLRVTVGDTVDFTLVNAAPMPHSMDFHAAEVAPDRVYRNILPGDSIQYRFVARVPGAFMYHCGTAPVALHIANGMYGALIVDPVRPRPPAREFVFVQSEFYLSAPHSADSVRSVDWDRLLNQAPDYVVFNGRADRYATSPIPVGAGELVRMYVVNAGPNRVSSFHVVGGIFDRVYADGFGSPFSGMQTWSIPVGGGAIFEVRLAEPGLYPFVTHAFADATKGAVGILKAEAPTQQR